MALIQFTKCLTYTIAKVILVCLLYCIYKTYLIDTDINQMYEEKIINLKDIDIVIDSDMCNQSDINILAIILVTSYVGNTKMRSAHRNAISQEKLKKMKLLRIFLTAEIPYNDIKFSKNELLLEQNTFNDLIQGNFVDSYRNLTYKIGMGFKWATTKCSNVKYIIKTDDDTVFDIYYLTNFLENFEMKLKNISEFIAGNILYSRQPIRQRPHVYFVPETEYENDKYPHYTAGMLYITNPTTVNTLLIASEKMKYFWIEDIFFTGIVRNKKQINLYHLNSWFTIYAIDIYCCLEIIKKFGYQCNYHIGPSDGDTQLFAQFLIANKKCFYDKCVKRSDLCRNNFNSNSK